MFISILIIITDCQFFSILYILTLQNIVVYFIIDKKKKIKIIIC